MFSLQELSCRLKSKTVNIVQSCQKVVDQHLGFRRSLWIKALQIENVKIKRKVSLFRSTKKRKKRLFNEDVKAGSISEILILSG